MDSFLLFFEQMPTWQKLFWVMTCLGLSWILEANLPLVQLQYRKWYHARANFVFLGTTLSINAVFSALALGVVAWTGATEFGLLHLFELPNVLEMMAAIIILDFTAQYFAHWLMHRVKFLWRFHVVHHSDTKVDATTGTRLHPGDFFVRECVALIALTLTGAPLAYYVVYRVTTIFFTFVTHANISLPRWLDAALSFVFVTPNMHKFHHHFERPWTDKNYGGILSIRDRLFGTLVYDDPNSVIYGVDVADPDLDEHVLHQMKLPFRGGSDLHRD